MTIDSFFNWSSLATFSGAVAAVVFIVQFLKLPLDKIKRVPTRIVVYFVSLVVLVLAQVFSGTTFSVETIALAVLNAVLVALSAMALYEQTISEPEARKNASLITSSDSLVQGEPSNGLTKDVDNSKDLKCK